MMSGYSLDLRKRVIALREKGEKQARIAELLGVSISTVKRYLVRQKQTGSVAASVQEQLKPMLQDVDLKVIEQQLEAHSDATIALHIVWFAERTGRQVSYSTMSRAIRRVGWTRKKRR